jgi:hypothetical protein
MVTEAIQKPNTTAKQLSIIDSRVILAPWGDDEEEETTNKVQVMDYRRDSYIILFEGRRGAGKTTLMSYMISMALAEGRKVYSNYPVEFMLRTIDKYGKSYIKKVSTDPLDFEKLLLFDDIYQNAIIAIDEAPEVISNMASMSWRNRLIGAFTRQIRKLNVSVFLAAQDFQLIDKSIRWQVDTIVKCQDAEKFTGQNGSLERGEVIWSKWYDQSGAWTGETTEDRYHKGEDPCVVGYEFYPRFLFGDKTHQAVFNSWQHLDILESLRKVDLKLTSIKIRDKTGEAEQMSTQYPVSTSALKSALRSIEFVFEQRPEEPNIFQKSFFDSLGGLTDADKNNLGKVLSRFNVERGTDGSNKRFYSFSSFDVPGFKEYIEKQGGA